MEKAGKNNKPKKILELIRIRNCCIAFFGVYVGATLAQGSGSLLNANVFVAAAAAFLILGGGNAINDYFDYEIDKINKPSRPVTSGAVSRSDALILSISFFLAGIGLSKYINYYCLAIAVANTLVLVAYAKFSKKLLFLSNLMIGYLVASIFAYGAAAASTQPDLSQQGIKTTLILSACAFFMTTSREIIKDIEDIEGDRKLYSNTIPIKFGIKKAKQVAVIFGLTAIILSAIPLLVYMENFNKYAYGLFIITADLIFISSYTTHATLNQKMLVVGMILALIAFFTGGIL